ncbi:hypothetical protein BH23CHL7_BH23CHL7_06320 [soil metagenome]
MPTTASLLRLTGTLVSRVRGCPDTPRSVGRRRSRGQSLAEFAVIAPVLFAMIGLTVDVARLYHGWVNLESATRDAAQYLATSNSNPSDPDYGASNKDQKAKFILDSATGATFTINSNQASCTGGNPTALVSATYSQSSSGAGASSTYPVGEAVVRSCMSFRTLVPWPILTIGGDFVLRSERTFRTAVGR